MVRKKKIAVVIPTLEGAGCEKLVAEMLPTFANHFEVNLIMYEMYNDFSIPKGIKVLTLDSKNRSQHSFAYKTIRLLYRVFYLGLLFRKHKYDLILSFIDGCNINSFLGKTLFGVKSRLILAEHTVNKNFFQYNKYSNKFKYIIKLLLYCAYNKSDRVVAISSSMRNFLVNDIGVKSNKIEIIYNGINTTNFNAREEFSLDLDERFESAKIKLITVGRLVEGKNQEFLIKLMPSILDKFPDARLFILGKGELNNRLLNIISKLNLSDRVFLLGWKNNVHLYLKKSDLFLFSSHYESFCNVVAESLMCGVPVITSRYDDVVDELIFSSTLGEAVDSNDKLLFEMQIAKYLINKKSKQSVAEVFGNRFDFQNTCSSYVSLIQKVVNE